MVRRELCSGSDARRRLTSRLAVFVLDQRWDLMSTVVVVIRVCVVASPDGAQEEKVEPTKKI